MSPSLSVTERRILEAADDAESEGVLPERFTDDVRHRLARMTGRQFRGGVARLALRHLLFARVTVKEGGEVGRVVIEGVTPLGRYAIGRTRSRRSEPLLVTSAAEPG